MARAGTVCSEDGCPRNAVTAGRCTECASRREVARGSASARGYDAEHRRKRARLLPRAYGRDCWICGRKMRPGQPLDLSHVIALRDDRSAKLSDMAHKTCNLGSDPPYDSAYDEGA